MDVAVDLAARGEDDRETLLARVLEHVEGHHGVLERAVWLPNELVHLRVRREVHDEVDLGVLDAVDPARERGVMAGQILEQIAELIRPRVLALVDPEDLMPVLPQAEGKIGPDLAGASGQQVARGDRRPLRTAQCRRR